MKETTSVSQFHKYAERQSRSERAKTDEDLIRDEKTKGAGSEPAQTCQRFDYLDGTYITCAVVATDVISMFRWCVCPNR